MMTGTSIMEVWSESTFAEPGPTKRSMMSELEELVEVQSEKCYLIVFMLSQVNSTALCSYYEHTVASVFSPNE